MPTILGSRYSRIMTAFINIIGMLKKGQAGKHTVAARDLSRARSFLQEISSSNTLHFSDSMHELINFYFDSPESNGILARLGREFEKYEPREWAQELERMVQHIQPHSEVFSQIMSKSRDLNTQMLLPHAYLHGQADSHTLGKGRTGSIQVTHSGISLLPLDAFYFALAYSIYSSEPPIVGGAQYEQLMLDDFYSGISHNPLLLLLRRHLQYFAIKDREMVFRIGGIMRSFLSDQMVLRINLDLSDRMLGAEPLRGYSQGQESYRQGAKKPTPWKYRLKPQHLHSIYLMLKFCPEVFNNDFPKYSMAIVEYYEEIRPDQETLAAFIRLWIYGASLGDSHNIEDKVVDVLEKATSQEGWFFLKRYSPSEISGSEALHPTSIQTAQGIIKLLDKEHLWAPSTNYLWTLACFFRFLGSSQIFHQDLDQLRRYDSREREETVDIDRILRNVVLRFNQSIPHIMSKIKQGKEEELKNSYEQVKTYQRQIQQYLQSYFKSKNNTRSPLSKRELSPSHRLGPSLPAEFLFDEMNDKELASVKPPLPQPVSPGNPRPAEIWDRGSPPTFYRREYKGCWEIPLQYNENRLLYYLAYGMAKAVDLLIPGRREEPANIRFLANPFIFVALVVCLSLMWFIFKS